MNEEEDLEQLKKDMLSPYWRYTTDVWYFAMLLSTGDVIGFECVESFKGDYVEVRALTSDYLQKNRFYAFGKTVVGSPTDRTTMHIRISSIVAMCELTNT